MAKNRRSFIKEIFSCKTVNTVIPYQSQSNNISNGKITTQNENHVNKIRRDSVITLIDDNLLADVNIEDAWNLYKVQVDALWSKESKLLIDAFEKCLLNNKSQMPLRILDIGCGTGELLTRLIGENGIFEKLISSENQLFIFGIELDQSVYQFCQQRLKNCKYKKGIEISIINGDATKLPFESNYFDLVLNRHMLHCLPKNDISIVINETWRILKSNGIAHFVVEDIEMIYTSVNNDQILSEQNQLWSNGIYETGALLGVDLRLGRKLPSILIKSAFVLETVEYVSVDSFHCQRELLIKIFKLWHKMYLDIWKHNRIDFQHKKAFENFLQVVQDENEYICWNVPIIQVIKTTESIRH